MKNLIIIIAVSIFLCSCGDDKTLPETTKIDNQEIERLNDWFATVFERDIMDSPEFLSDTFETATSRTLSEMDFASDGTCIF